MSASAGATMKPNRFANILSHNSCARPLYDEVICETHGCVVAPTLGSLLPNWLLVIPRQPAINFAAWYETTHVAPAETVEAVLDRFGVAAKRAIWLEHGPASQGSVLGCGVDQAHIHIIIDPPFTFDALAEAAAAKSRLYWETAQPSTVHQDMPSDASYLIAAADCSAITTRAAEGVGSQFFRRVIADLTDQAGDWDYKLHPNLPNVRKTIRNFGNQVGL